MKRVIVYGGQGGLGKVLVSHLKQKGYWIVSGTFYFFLQKNIQYIKVSASRYRGR